MVQMQSFVLLIKHKLVLDRIMSDYGDESNNETIAYTPSLAIIQLLNASLF